LPFAIADLPTTALDIVPTSGKNTLPGRLLMEHADVVRMLTQLHRDAEADGGFDPDRVTPTTCPLTGLKGFDSQLIPQFVRQLARELGSPLAKGTKIKNIYVSKDGKRKLSIDEVARRFLETYAPEVCRT
jgi:hypothetical protein